MARARVVEVRGVEPRSEEKNLKTSPYIACPLGFTDGNSDKQDSPAAISGVPLSWLHPSSLRTMKDYPISVDVPGIPDGQRTQGTGCLVFRQPVRSRSWHFCVFRLFNVDPETTVCSPEHPHPRRIQVTPMTIAHAGRFGTGESLPYPSNIHINKSTFNSFAGAARINRVIFRQIPHKELERLPGSIDKSK